MHTPEDPEHYLRRDFYGSSANGGTPFLDGRNAAQVEGQNLILYGHKHDGRQYVQTADELLGFEFPGVHKDIFLELNGKQYHYEVLAVVETSVDSSLYAIQSWGPGEEIRLPLRPV